MKILAKYMPIDETTEKVICKIEGNAYTSSSSPLARIMAFLERIMSILTGSQRKLYVYATDKRVIVIGTTKFLWIFDSGTSATSCTARSITRASNVFSRDFIIFTSHYLEFSAGGLDYLVRASGGNKDQVNNMIKSLNYLAERVASYR